MRVVVLSVSSSSPTTVSAALDAATPGDDPGLAQLDLLSVICIETSHYVCFTRDPRDEIEKKWIFFDSMADRQCESAFTNIDVLTCLCVQMTRTTFHGSLTALVS